MKKTALIVSTLVAIAYALPAHALVGDALEPIYRVSGVVDSGSGPGAGTATILNCTNFNNAGDEEVRVITRTWHGANLNDQTRVIAAKQTFTFGTHNPNIYFMDALLTPGTIIDQGSFVIESTSTRNVFCSVQVINAAAPRAQGYSLNMVRFNPAPNSTEDSQTKAVGDPLQVIYRVTGIFDNGGGTNSGSASILNCTNYNNSGSEEVRVITRQWNGSLLDDRTEIIPAKDTRTFATHLPDAYGIDFVLTPGVLINQGSWVVSASRITNVFCTAQVVDAFAINAIGYSLNMVRFNPVPNTEE
jgi:hypothetical protein